MPKYKPIKIKLNEQEDAEVYYQKVCGKNETVRRHARILYYAGQGTASMKELCQKAECDYGTAHLLLERYEKDGIMAMYQCKRGKRPCQLDEYEKEIEEELDKHLAKSVPEIIVKKKVITIFNPQNYVKADICDKHRKVKMKFWTLLKMIRGKRFNIRLENNSSSYYSCRMYEGWYNQWWRKYKNEDPNC